MSEMTSFEFPKTPVEEFVLPRGLLVKRPDGNILLQTARFHEITGAEEDHIANDKLSFTRKMMYVVAGCIEEIRDDDGNSISTEKELLKAVGQLSIADLTAALFCIRIVTVGEEYRQVIECPSERCSTIDGRPYSWTVRLNIREDFPIKRCEGDPLQNVRTYVTKRGRKITWKFMTGDARIRFEAHPGTTDRATSALMMRVLSVDDQPASKDLLRMLSMIDRKEIRDHMVSQEGGIDTSIKAVCPNCGNTFETSIVLNGFDFFFPSETLED